MQSVRGSRRPEKSDPTLTGADPLNGLQAGRSTPKQTTDHKGPATAMGISLTPLASLCLGVVRGWINVARRGKGGQIDDQGTAWTRLPADQLRDQLAREFLVEVSTRSIQRALKELEEQNQIRREQRWKHRYKRDYWYAVPEQEEQLLARTPKAIAGKFKSERSRPTNRIEPTRASGQVLLPPDLKTQFSERPASDNTLQSTRREMPRSTTSGTARTRKETHMRGVLERCEEIAQSKRDRPSSAGQGFRPTNTPSEGTRHGSHTPTGPMQTPNNGNPAGRDHQGRPMREVWVGGVPHLVID